MLGKSKGKSFVEYCFFRWKFSYLEMTEKLKKRLEGMQKENDELRARLNVPSQENSSSTA